MIGAWEREVGGGKYSCLGDNGRPARRESYQGGAGERKMGDANSSSWN